MSDPKDQPDTPASVAQWLQAHDDDTIDDYPLPVDMSKDAQDAQGG